jgi:hypothetical protein
MGIRYATGRMTIVVSGIKTIKVITGFTPKEVWLNLNEPHGIPVCHAEMDSFDCRIIPDGFVLVVKLSSEYRSIEWIAKGKRNKRHRGCND